MACRVRLSLAALLILEATTSRASAFVSPQPSNKALPSATDASKVSPNKAVLVTEDLKTKADDKQQQNDDKKKLRRADARKRWGIDNAAPQDEYWFDQRIHSLGNIGLGGGLHAVISPLATKRIDDVAYGGVDLRLAVAKELSQRVKAQKARVLDMCCGVGMSTRALRKAFPDAIQVMGLDTSPQMVAMAHFVTHHLQVVTPFLQAFRQWVATLYQAMRHHGRYFEQAALHQWTNFTDLHFINANAQDTKLPSQSFDLITVMYAFHEAPNVGRLHILQEAQRLLSPGGVLAIIDLSTDYTPSPAMLAGEPYVLEYQQNIHGQLKAAVKGLSFQAYKTLIPGHVGMWTLRRPLAA